MPRTTSDPIDNAWAFAFQEALYRGKQPPPNQGWLSRDDIQVKFGLSTASSKRKITEMVKLGLLDTFKGSIIRGQNPRTQYWYRPVNLRPKNSKKAVWDAKGNRMA